MQTQASLLWTLVALACAHKSTVSSNSSLGAAMFLNLCDCTKNAQQRSQRKTNCKISSQCRSSSNDRASCATQGPDRLGSALCMHTLSCNCIYNILQSVVRSGQCFLWCYEWFCNTRIQADSPKGPSLNAISANRPLSWHSSSASDGASRQPAETFKRTQKSMRETRLIPL